MSTKCNPKLRPPLWQVALIESRVEYDVTAGDNYRDDARNCVYMPLAYYIGLCVYSTNKWREERRQAKFLRLNLMKHR